MLSSVPSIRIISGTCLCSSRTCVAEIPYDIASTTLLRSSRVIPSLLACSGRSVTFTAGTGAMELPDSNPPRPVRFGQLRGDAVGQLLQRFEIFAENIHADRFGNAADRVVSNLVLQRHR